MLNAIVVVRFVILSFGGHGHVALENVALRQQLSVLKRDNKRPRAPKVDGKPDFYRAGPSLSAWN